MIELGALNTNFVTNKLKEVKNKHGYEKHKTSDS